MWFGGGGGGGQGGGGTPNFFFPGFGGPNTNGQMPAGGGAFNPLEMLFGAGGVGPGGVQMDPTLIENLFGPGAAAGMGMGGFGQGGAPAAEEPRSSAPPTSKATYRSLPRIKVSAHDIEKNESNECSICLDELVLGQPALRIPCGHLYHEDCVQDWLKKSNECPVCRFELPTDDATYERGRKERMADRKIRLRHEDLTVKSCAELRRLADYLKIDTRGCLEKNEFVERIAASDQVQIVDAQEATDDGVGTSLSSTGLFDYATGVAGSADMAPPSAPASAMGSDVGPAVREKRPRSESDATAAAAVPSGPPLAGQSVGQLKQLAKQIGVSLDGCLEKSDIVQRIRDAPGYRET